jgi:hypothetical protein
MFADGSAIGQRIRMGIHSSPAAGSRDRGRRCRCHIYDLKDSNLAGVYVPSLQEPDLVDGKCFIIRGNDVSLEAIQVAVAPFGYEFVTSSQSLEYIVDRVLLQERLLAMFATFLGVVALLLAAIGLYGLMSFEIGQRLHEIAIRVALGADRAHIVRRVVGDGLLITVAGLARGSVVALASEVLCRSAQSRTSS